MAMTSALKAQWLEALRSGEYHQGREALEVTTSDGKTYNCCLGVLCRVMDLPADSDGLFDEQNRVSFDFGPFGEATGYLPGLWADEVGIGDQQHDLADMNDSGKSFAEIADWIERNL